MLWHRSRSRRLQWCCLAVLATTSAVADSATQHGLDAEHAGRFDDAVVWFRKGAQAGDEAAQVRLGLALAQGRGIAQDLQEALNWFQEAASNGSAEGHFNVWRVLRGQDPAQAFPWLQRGAQLGWAAAQNSLGLTLAKGRDGQAQDHAAALEWFQRAAEQDDPQAQNNLALALQDGRGAEADPSTAAMWFHRAAVHGHQGAQFNFGSALAQGSGVRQDLDDALTWFELAARGRDQVLVGKAQQATEHIRRVLEETDDSPAALTQRFITGPGDADKHLPLSTRAEVRWTKAIAHLADFNSGFERERVVDTAAIALLRATVNELTALLNEEELSVGRRHLALTQLTQAYASLARDGSSEDLVAAGRWNLELAQTPECVEAFAATEIDPSCWNTAISAAVTQFRRAGDLASAEQAVQLGRQHSLAATHYTHTVQTPHVFFPGLPSVPWWPAAAFSITTLLEANHARLVKDLESLVGKESSFQRVLSPAAPIRPGHDVEDEKIKAAGAWSELPLFDGHTWDKEACAKVPSACELLRQETELCGIGADADVCGTRVVVSLFRLEPGSRVLAHTGVTNRRLIMQFALRGSDGVRFRVGDEWRPYGGDGKAIVFDDSFEHEVEHKGKHVRYVLYAVLVHPDVAHETGSSCNNKRRNTRRAVLADGLASSH